MRILGLDLERLIRIVEASKINSLEVEGPFHGYFKKVKIEKKEGAKVISCYVPPLPTKKERNMERRKMKYQDITSPGIGQVYLSDPRVPNSKPYVKKGSKVKKGDVVGLIKHLKVYDEIISPYEGPIREMYIVNGQKVDWKFPLFKVRVKN